MKKILFIIFFITNTALAYFPVGECFNAQMNFGLGANMGFGANGFGGANNLMVPTGFAFNNPYAYYNGFGGNAMMGVNGFGNPYMNPMMMGGAGLHVGLNMGPIAPLLMQLMTGGIYVGAGIGAGINNGARMGPMPMNYGNFGPQYPGNAFWY